MFGKKRKALIIMYKSGNSIGHYYICSYTKSYVDMFIESVDKMDKELTDGYAITDVVKL